MELEDHIRQQDVANFLSVYYDDCDVIPSHQYLVCYTNVCFLDKCSACCLWYVLPYTDYSYVDSFSRSCGHCGIRIYMCKSCLNIVGGWENIRVYCRECKLEGV